jgi:hypothetical protein
VPIPASVRDGQVILKLDSRGRIGMTLSSLRQWLAERVPIPMEELRCRYARSFPSIADRVIWLAGHRSSCSAFGRHRDSAHLHYTPDPARAFDSVRRITWPRWLLIRSLHQNAAQS